MRLWDLPALVSVKEEDLVSALILDKAFEMMASILLPYTQFTNGSSKTIISFKAAFES